MTDEATCRHCGQAIHRRFGVMVTYYWSHVHTGLATCLVGLQVVGVDDQGRYLVAAPGLARIPAECE